jgi:hypothetical protein
MNKYLLLRDNKQTGPYTAKELAEKGLKPYDLVWVEGKSAAWRYPGEIDELKSFAPGVEEQPYDRFYKKQDGQSTQQAVTANAVQESQPVAKPVEHKSKHIYVTMPGGAKVPAAKKEETAKPVTQQNDKNANSAAAKNTEKKVAASSYIISEEDDELNSGMLKGYQSRKKEDDEINNGFLSEYESRKASYSKNKTVGATVKETIKEPVAEKPVTPKKESWSTPKKKEQFDMKALLAGSGKYLQDNKNLTRGLVAAVLILGGVVIGLVINSGRRQPDNQVLESLVKEIREQQNEKGSNSTSAVETSQKDNEPQEKQRSRNENEDDHNNNNIAEPAAPPAPASVNKGLPGQQPDSRRSVIRKDNNVVPPPQSQNNRSITVSVSNPSSQPVEATPAVLETKEKTINPEVIEKARKNIYEQVRIEASAFKVGVFGGVSDLDITLINSSLYTLDQVAVEVKYFGMEKKLVKTQTIIFNNVPPGKRRTLEVPKTSRGITIDYNVISINSKALGLAQAGF